MRAPLPPLPVEDLDHVLAHTLHLWPEAKGANIFITGGTGFFGMWLLESLAHANDRLGLGMSATVLTRDPAAFARKAPHLATRSDLRVIAGDMRSFTFPSGNFRFVIHAASDTSIPPDGADPEPIRRAIVEGTSRVLDFAAQARARKFLLTSSGGVYGPQPPELTRIPEDFPPGPVTGYSRGKLEAEALCHEKAGKAGFDCSIARCFAFVGPHLPLDAHFAIGNFIRDAMRGDPIRVKGDGRPRRSYLHAADLAAWLWTLLLVDAPRVVYNVGSAQCVSIADAARLVAERSGGRVAVQIAGVPRPGDPVARYVPDVSRAEAELGLRTWIGLPEAVDRTLRWWRMAGV